VACGDAAGKGAAAHIRIAEGKPFLARAEFQYRGFLG
jgi:hypothetical protein